MPPGKYFKGRPFLSVIVMAYGEEMNTWNSSIFA